MDGCHPLALLMDLGRSRELVDDQTVAMSLLGQNLISNNVENNSRTAENFLHSHPSFNVCPHCHSRSDLKMIRSQATPDAGRIGPGNKDTAVASRSSTSGFGCHREAVREGQAFCLEVPQRMELGELVLMAWDSTPESWAKQSSRAKEPILCYGRATRRLVTGSAGPWPGFFFESL